MHEKPTSLTRSIVLPWKLIDVSAATAVAYNIQAIQIETEVTQQLVCHNLVVLTDDSE